MSYILDALRRAEAERERERGAVPGVHAQPALLPETPARLRLQVPAWWGVAAGGLLGATLVTVLWWAGRGAVAPLPTATPAPVAAVAPTAAVPQLPSPAPLAVVSAPVLLPSPAPPPAASAAVPPVPPVPPAMPVLPALPAQQAAAPIESRPQPWGELSAEQKREWPALSIGGSIYSDNASSRFVMINGQVVREGETAAPGVTVERIRPKSAVLRFKDRRVELPF